MQPFTLEAGELLLDQPAVADIDAIARYCQDPVFEKFMTLPWPYERKDAEFFVNEYVPGGWRHVVRWEAVDGNAASLAVARKTGFRYTGIGPALVTARDGTSPQSWQAELAASDTRTPTPGWPNEFEGDRPF